MLKQTNFQSLLTQGVKNLNLISDKPASKTWMPSLDGLRAIAVILVFLEHVTGNVFRNDTSESGAFFAPFLNFGDAGMGRSGVYLFFVLSSFLLTSQLLRLNTNFKNPSLWVNYAFKRMIRIYPLYFFILLVYFIFPSFQYDLSDVFRHLTLQSAKNHFWTIPVEIKYYFILPCVVWLTVKILKQKLLKTTIVYASLILAFELFESSLWEPTRLSILPHLSIFLIGSLAALVHSKILNLPNPKVYRVRTGMEVISILALLGIFLSLQTPLHHTIWHWIFNTKMPIIEGNHWLYIIQGILWAVFLVSHLHGWGWMSRLISWRPLRYIGIISFGIYLWHIAILGYFNAHLTVPSIVKLLVIWGFTVLAATITYVLVERPFMGLKLPLSKSFARPAR